jgi:F0F1-type ATP synthase membrane subunit b/b'
MTLVGALAAMALVGCNNGRSADQANRARENLQDTTKNAQEDLASAKQSAANQVNDARQNLNETKQDAQKKVNETAQNGQQEIQQQRQDLNQARQNEAATGGSGEAMASQSGTVLGTLTDMDTKSLTIKDSAGNEVELQRSGSTTVTQDGRAVSADQLQKGTEVRANYKVDKNGDKWAESVTLQAQPTDHSMAPTTP